MAHPQLSLSNDELLTTTRAVRKRLDFERPVTDETLKECLAAAVQAPSGSNVQGWQFVFVRDEAKRRRIGELYAQAYALYRTLPVAIHKQHRESGDASLVASQGRSASSADFLAENIGRAPVLFIPCITGRSDAEGSNGFIQASVLASIIPAAWSFMLAARARGIGTAWTSLHLMYEQEVAELLGIPFEEVMQVALIPVAYTVGTSFQPACRPLVESVMHIDAW